MWIDTHCHLQASEFSLNLAHVITQAVNVGVERMIVPAVCIEDIPFIQTLAQMHPQVFYTLGIHPLYVMQASEADLTQLREVIILALDDPKFLGVGEIGLDGFVNDVDFSLQVYFYIAQLKIAREFDLPVLLHVRKAQDQVLKYLRQIKVKGGIAHAFNGSFQQAHAFIDLNFKLGFGGAMTFTRALQIRRLACELPLESIVLETDAPDIAPAWLASGEYNTPDQVPKIAQVLAELCGVDVAEIARQTNENVAAVLPRLRCIGTY